MINSPKVVLKIKGEYALNNVDRKVKNVSKLEKNTIGMFDYYGNEEKRVLNMFDYFDGTLTKDKHINIMLENGEYATKEEIEKRKKEYLEYIKYSNIWKCVISFDNKYLTTKTNHEQLEKELVKEMLPIFFKKIGFDKIENMSYQIALHTDTDNLHYHFSFIEKKPNFNYLNGIDYRRKIVINEKDMNFLKNQIVHNIEKNMLYKPTLIKTNETIDELKRYFNSNEKCFILYDKFDLELENKIYNLGKVLNENNIGKNGKIKYNSINNKEIKSLVKDIKKYIFKKNNIEFQDEYKKFKNNLNIINDYFKKISNDNNIKKFINNDLIKNKETYLNNYILNKIVNYAKDNYKVKRLNQNKIIKEIIYDKYKVDKLNNKTNILKHYLSNTTNRFHNKYEIERAIKNINYEMEESIKEFRKMFNYDLEN